MAVWTNTRCTGHWPVGFAAVVVAHTSLQATELLNAQLVAQGLAASATPDQFVRIDEQEPGAIILVNGEY